MKAQLVLRPAASKRLIARGVAALPQVRDALRDRTVVVTLGTTNGYVAEELLGQPFDRGAFAAGVIDTRWNVNARLGEASDLVLERGVQVPFDKEKTLTALTAGDVIIKGGNALDPWGTVGVLLAAATGGTVGRYVPLALARGVEIVIPISVAKSIHTSVSDLAMQMGSRRIELGEGLPCGIFPLVGHVVSEIEAFDLLFGVQAAHVASGGVGEGRGSVSLLLDGDEESVRAAMALAHSLASEPDEGVEGRA